MDNFCTKDQDSAPTAEIDSADDSALALPLFSSSSRASSRARVTIPYPHSRALATLDNVDLLDVVYYRCLLCGRRLELATGTSTLRCPWHGALQKKQLARPTNPRKRNPIPREMIELARQKKWQDTGSLIL